MPRYRSDRGVCCVHGCETSPDSLPKRNFFKFPKRPEEAPISTQHPLGKWIHAVKLPGIITRDMIICDQHFDKDDFYHTQEGNIKLKKDALPSQNLPSVWRNKFYPREYGKLVKLLEFRGIGRLRLCYEAKLVRRLRKKNEKLDNNREKKKKKKNVKPPQHKLLSKRSKSIRVSSTFSLSSTENAFNNNEENGTSDIMIKEESLYPEDDGVQSVEEMLARMNEDSNEPGNSEDTAPPKSDKMGDKEGSGMCDVCGKDLKTPKQLLAHKLTHARNQKKKPEGTKKADSEDSGPPFLCMLCEQSFKTKESLMKHVNTHSFATNFSCKVCKSFFDSVEELDIHFKLHRLMKRVYSCRECGDKFKSKAECWAHLNEHLRPKKSYGVPCEVCGRVLSSKETLREHMFIHSGEKPFECQLCGAKVRHRANFINHVEGHALNMSHPCSFCSMSFMKKVELNSHVAAQHPNQKQFNCTICGLSFRTEARFLKHAVSHDANLEE